MGCSVEFTRYDILFSMFERMEAKLYDLHSSLHFQVQGGFAMRKYIPELMPMIVEALLDGAAAAKREVAITTLGQVVQSTGYEFLLMFLILFFPYGFSFILFIKSLSVGG